MVKTILLLAAVGAALGAGVANASTGARDVYTDGASTMGARDPYTDGAGTMGTRDPYTDGSKAGRFDVYTEGMDISRPNDCYPNCGTE
ncbi:hypothetical protein PSUB009319_12230 [Ralstonia sp. SET104]|nr:hypothetical protein PSUB009319_12230 [Ralstonia sp. SET104]